MAEFVEILIYSVITSLGRVIVSYLKINWQ